MPSMKLSVPHSHDKEVAAEKLKSFTVTIKEFYGDQVSDLRETWIGDSLQFGFSAKGLKVSGQVDVEDDQVKLDSKLPLAAMMFRGVIETKVREALDKALA
jgi:putative polyhydroxyalkanoate system protein